MLSIIVCSRNSILPNSFITNIEKTVGVVFEIICIDNSKSEYSIASAYNEGIKRSKFPYFCFVHDDVLFHTQNWGENVIAHLNVPNTGLVGLAGGDAALRVPYDFGALHPSMNIIHIDKKGIEPTEYVFYPRNYAKSSRSVVLLDGVMICSKRETFDKIRFDENIGKFHGYDYDIAIQSIIAGYYNYVMYDITMEHYSKGNMDETYFRTMIKVYKKWESNLPIFEHNISGTEQKVLQPKFEKRSLNKLLKKLVRAKLKTAEIVEIFTYYTKKIGSKLSILLLITLRIRILIIWITSLIRRKIK